MPLQTQGSTQTELQQRCSIYCIYTSQTQQCILQVHCMYSIYSSYTVLLAVDLQYILHPTASILHFGPGREQDRIIVKGAGSMKIAIRDTQFSQHTHNIIYILMENGQQLTALRKKVEPKWLHPGAVLENGATLEGGAVLKVAPKLMSLWSSILLPPTKESHFFKSLPKKTNLALSLFSVLVFDKRNGPRLSPITNAHLRPPPYVHYIICLFL